MARSPDSEFLARAAGLAARGRFRVEPNPPVGCLLVRAGRVVGEGFHAEWGGPHAEAAALAAAGGRARGATAYVTLEPCGHQGKTPPCAEALLRAGVREVVYALPDPHPVTAGKGPALLRAAGVPVRKARAPLALRELMRPYLRHLSARRPWVIAKWAMSLDGRIAARGGDARWISGEESRAFVHETLRARVDAILVGAGTVRRDDPSLTNRSGRGGQPLRVVLAGRKGVSEKARLFGLPGETVVVSGPGGRVDLDRLLRDLFARGVRRLLVEGGGRVLGSFLDRRLVDQVAVFVAPRLLGGGVAAAEGRGVEAVAKGALLAPFRATPVGGDLLVEGLVSGPSPRRSSGRTSSPARAARR